VQPLPVPHSHVLKTLFPLTLTFASAVKAIHLTKLAIFNHLYQVDKIINIQAFLGDLVSIRESDIS
jgi:hypothetical protein